MGDDCLSARSDSTRLPEHKTQVIERLVSQPEFWRKKHTDDGIFVFD